MLLPLVSVIMPCYNQGQFLEDAVNSVLLQTHTNWECIIINDGSSDHTDEIAKKCCTLDSRIRYFKNENKGVSHARNFAIANATATYILPLDADDKISINYIEDCLKLLLEDQNTKVAYGTVEQFGSSSWELILDDFESDYLKFSNMIPCSGLFRKQDWVRIAGYDEQMIEGYEDWEFWINLLKNGGIAKRTDSAVLYYRIKPESRMTGIDAKRRYRLIAYIMHKHPELYEEMVLDYTSNLNINFAYSYYLSTKTYHKKNLVKLQEAKKQYKFRLNKELAQYSFFKRKKVLFYWYKKGKFNLNFLNFLTY